MNRKPSRLTIWESHAKLPLMACILKLHPSLLCTIALLLCIPGCQSPQREAPRTVSSAWQEPPSQPAEVPASSSLVPPQLATSSVASDSGSIAIVNGVPVSRESFVSALIEAHGLPQLEQLVALEVSTQAAERAGFVVSQSDIEDEYFRSLDRLLGDEDKSKSKALRSEAGEALLKEVLASRNLSHGTYMLIMERNACLRKLALRNVRLEDDAVRVQYSRMYGERVQVRHIQVLQRSELDKVVAEHASGVDFPTLAVKYSANRDSAERLGMLEPFSADDPEVPRLLRKAAFDMSVGDPAKPVFADGWYHFMKLERKIPASEVTFEEVRSDVEDKLRDRLLDVEMQRLYASLMREADIQVMEPGLQERFYERYGQVTSDADTSESGAGSGPGK